MEELIGNVFLNNKHEEVNPEEVLNGDWGLGIGDWGLGIGDWANPQSPIPIPNPQSPIILKIQYIKIKLIFEN